MIFFNHTALEDSKMLRYSRNFLMLMRNLQCCKSQHSASLQVGWNTETYERKTWRAQDL